MTLKIPANSVTYRTALDLLLRSIGCQGSLSFDTREGLIYLTQESQSLIVDVYNVRDLIGQPPVYGATAHMSAMMSGGEGAMMSSMGGSADSVMGGAGPAYSPRYTRVQLGGGGAAAGPGGSGPGMMGMPGSMPPGGGGGGGVQGGSGPVATDLGRPLVAMIVEVLEPDAWTTAGGSSSIGEVDGLLVVRTTTRMHRSLTDLLAKMRAAKSGATPAVQGIAPMVPAPGGSIRPLLRASQWNAESG